MSDSSRHDRLLELLADRALVGLDAAEETELAGLLKEFPDEDADAFDRAAASTMLAHLKIEPLPENLAARIETQTPEKNSAIAASPAAKKSAPSASTRAVVTQKSDPTRYLGWLAAAACFAFAVYTLKHPPPAPIIDPLSSASKIAASQPPPVAPPLTPKASLADQRVQLATDPMASKIAWSATKDPGGEGASGDVVFSVAKQTGFMRFHGLAANDPKQHQYQLWIFDKAQDAKYPIDGGVFDVTQNPADPNGDVIVQIQPKIRVTDPTLFAVTIETPGGVVVSKREHIVVTAAKI